MNTTRKILTSEGGFIIFQVRTLHAVRTSVRRPEARFINYAVRTVLPIDFGNR